MCGSAQCDGGTGLLDRRSAIPKVHHSESPMCTGV